MDELDNRDAKCFSKDVIEGNKTVTVYVRLLDGYGWELVIIGRANQMTSWTQWFPSAGAAMNEGLTAILKEGIDEFYYRPEFSCADTA